MNAGRRVHLVTIEQPKVPPPTTASGSVNKEDPTYWESFGTAWVEIRTIAGTERFRLGDFNTQSTHYVLGLGQDLVGITEKMRLVLGARTFDILSIDDLSRPLEECRMEVREGRGKGN